MCIGPGGYFAPNPPKFRDEISRFFRFSGIKFRVAVKNFARISRNARIFRVRLAGANLTAVRFAFHHQATTCLVDLRLKYLIREAFFALSELRATFHLHLHLPGLIKIIM